MIRDTFFSASRFMSLCRKEMVESWKTNVLRFVMMYGIMAIIFVWSGYLNYDHPERLLSKGVTYDPMWKLGLVAFLWAVVIMGMLGASFVMERMKTKTNRIAVLMTPATMVGLHFRFLYRLSDCFQDGGLDTRAGLSDLLSRTGEYHLFDPAFSSGGARTLLDCLP